MPGFAAAGKLRCPGHVPKRDDWGAAREVLGTRGPSLGYRWWGGGGRGSTLGRRRGRLTTLTRRRLGWGAGAALRCRCDSRRGDTLWRGGDIGASGGIESEDLGGLGPLEKEVATLGGGDEARDGIQAGKPRSPPGGTLTSCGYGAPERKSQIS